MFVSCDWGTSTFRLRLVDPSSQQVLAEVKSSQGIADTHMKWTQLARDETYRYSFYLSIIKDQLQVLQEQVTHSLQGLPLLVSGMASSSIGMVELPYKMLPFAINGRDLEFIKMNPSESFKHEVIIISGARTSSDIMRGEETQLIGCDFGSDEERIYIFPGTHSKHITVRDQHAVDFKTYMTGEFFQLLSHHSILSRSVQEGHQSLSGETLKTFEEGVARSIHDNLLHNAFLVRTNHLSGNFSKELNYHYLSGLLIGTELRELAHSTVKLTIVASESMREYYIKALQALGRNNVETYDADIALVKGHCKVYHVFKNNR